MIIQFFSPPNKFLLKEQAEQEKKETITALIPKTGMTEEEVGRSRRGGMEEGRKLR